MVKPNRFNVNMILAPICVPLFTDVLVEHVALDEFPKDCWHIEMAEIRGFLEREIHEDSSTILRKNQAEKKFDS